ncbi:prolactin-releasing peptide receptor-like [Amphiura filiformis]|uniref:prolactin-releasing peptide receptor-like n=1 Tax=Amphiura filiformis TaxID=82378 RepID=UPI003B21D282
MPFNATGQTIWGNLSSVCTEGNTQFYQNATEEEIGPLLRTKSARLTALILYPFILAFGVLTNTLFLIVLLRIEQMRTVTNYYLSHLACCDIALILLITVEQFYEHAHSPIKHIAYTTGEVCAFVTFLQFVAVYTSMNLVTLVGFERFMAICYPIQHRLVSGMQRTKYFVITSWAVSTILGAVSAPLFGTVRKLCVLWPDREPYHTFPIILPRCEPVHPFFVGFARGLMLCYFLLAVVVSIYMYYKIIVQLNNRVHPGSKSNYEKKPNSRIVAMLIVNGVVFFVCLAPYRVLEVYVLLSIHGKVDHHDWIDTMVAVVLGALCINSTVNPIIYGLTNPKYRQSFWRVIKCSSKAEINVSTLQPTQPTGTTRQSQLQPQDQDTGVDANRASRE